MVQPCKYQRMKLGIAESVPGRASVHTRTGAPPYNAIQDMSFFKVSFVSINS